MKRHRKLIAAFAILIALGIVGTAIAVTYYAHTPITDVSITGTLSNGDSVSISSDYTMTCTTSTDTDKYCDDTGWHYPSDPVTHTWSGPGAFNPTTGTSVTWTAPSSTGDKTITVTADDSPLYDETAKTDSITVKVVKVDKLQYWDGISSIWVDIGSTLYVAKDDAVIFKAIPDPSGASWPSGKPVWGGEASGTGPTTPVTFNTLSNSTSDYKTVTAECGNTPPVKVNVIVYDFEGTLTPDDGPPSFAGRSMTDYGIAETVDLNCTITLGLTASQVGGLKWSEGLGKGSLSNVTNYGTADYDAGAYPGTANLYLSVQSGPSRESFRNYVRNITEPDAYMIQEPNTGIWHEQGTASVGFKGYIYLTPMNVSFDNLQFREYSCPAILKGFYKDKYPDGYDHPIRSPVAVGSGNISTGCRVLGTDTVSTGPHTPPPPFKNNSSFTWVIPWQYLVSGGAWTEFTTATHVATMNKAGTATIEKHNVGPFTKALNDPNSPYYPN